MKSTKDKILQTLLRRPKISIIDLAEAVGINPISVRHHLTNLQMEGLIAADEERHGVGRPRLVYSLTEDGMEKFPTKYFRLTTRLLNQMKETMPGPVVAKLFNQIAEDLASEYSSQIQGLSMEERLDFVKEMLAQEGFTVEQTAKAPTSILDVGLRGRDQVGDRLVRLPFTAIGLLPETMEDPSPLEDEVVAVGAGREVPVDTPRFEQSLHTIRSSTSCPTWNSSRAVSPIWGCSRVCG